jgi:hypothetical protein
MLMLGAPDITISPIAIATNPTAPYLESRSTLFNSSLIPLLQLEGVNHIHKSTAITSPNQANHHAIRDFATNIIDVGFIVVNSTCKSINTSSICSLILQTR